MLRGVLFVFSLPIEFLLLLTFNTVPSASFRGKGNLEGRNRGHEILLDFPNSWGGESVTNSM